MGFEGHTPVANVSFVHMLTTTPQFCIAPSDIGPEFQFAHLPHDSVPTLRARPEIS